MPFWVYGHDSETGEPDQFLSDATTEDAARADATAQGLLVAWIAPAEVQVEPADAEMEPPITQAAELQSGRSFGWYCLGLAQFFSVLGCLASVVCTIAGLAKAASGYASPGSVVLAWGFIILVGFCSFCYSAAMYIVFTHVRQRLRA